MTARRTRTRFGGALVAIAALALVGCDLGPGGPDEVAGAVRGGPDLAGAVLEVSWPAARGFEARGSTQVYAAPVAGAEDRYRVVLLSTNAGELPFKILVQSRFTSAPVVTIVEAVGTDNQSISTGGLRVVIGR